MTSGRADGAVLDGYRRQEQFRPQRRENLGMNSRERVRQTPLKRRKVFWLGVLLFLTVVCLTGITVIAIIHFKNSGSEINKVGAGSLIGFGFLLVVVLAWSVYVYAKFGGSSARHSSQRIARHEDPELVATSSPLAMVHSSLPTDISTANNRLRSSVTGSTPQRNVGINSGTTDSSNVRHDMRRERPSGGEARANIDRNNRNSLASPLNSASCRIMRQHHQEGRRSRSLQMCAPEWHLPDIDLPGMRYDSSGSAARFIQHTSLLPPPYHQAHIPSYILPAIYEQPPSSPPPAYDRVFCRRQRSESITSEGSSPNPPSYQSAPPSPSPYSVTPQREGVRPLSSPMNRPLLLSSSFTLAPVPQTRLRATNPSLTRSELSVSCNTSAAASEEQHVICLSNPTSHSSTRTGSSSDAFRCFNQTSCQLRPPSSTPASPVTSSSDNLTPFNVVPLFQSSIGTSPPSLSPRQTTSASQPTAPLTQSGRAVRVTSVPRLLPPKAQQTSVSGDGRENETGTNRQRSNVILVYLSQSTQDN